MIVVDDVSKYYGSKRAVEGLSFEVEQGDTVGKLLTIAEGLAVDAHMGTGILRRLDDDLDYEMIRYRSRFLPLVSKPNQTPVRVARRRYCMMLLILSPN